jgi:hypothetical protein
VKKLLIVITALAALAAPTAAMADGTTVMPNRFCLLTVAYPGLPGEEWVTYPGVGLSLITPVGYTLLVCRAAVAEPAETIAFSFSNSVTGAHTGSLVVTKSGVAILIARRCGPSSPEDHLQPGVCPSG